ncbi:MAG: response regulator transcription factor [Candidatus Methylacidiphilales bacterium]
MSVSSSPQTVRILLIDDHFVVRMGLASSLADEPGFVVVGEAGTGGEGQGLYAKLKPDLVIVDLQLPDMHGAEVVAAIRAADPRACCVMLSVNEGEDDIFRSVQAGARAYLSKSISRDQLIKALHQVLAGKTFFPDAIRARLEKRQQRPELTVREGEVLDLIVEGLLNKEIADRLGVAEITIKQHVSAILRKLNVQDRTQAAMAAVERGIVRHRGSGRAG